MVISYSEYHGATAVNDITMLKLSYPLPMTDSYVSSICILSVSQATLSAGEWPPAATNVRILLFLEYMLIVTLQTVDYRASTYTPMMADWTVQLYAGVSGGDKDTCQGDSGGLLMIFSSNSRWMLIGVTSSGIGCALTEYSGIYTRVAAYNSSINSNTNGSISSFHLSQSSSAFSTDDATLTNSSTTETHLFLLDAIRLSFQIVYSCNLKATCGCSSNPVSMNRIVGGDNASEATWGWAVSIAINNSMLCTGSILSSSWIITAAHCVEDYSASEFTVYAGSTFLWSGTQNRSVSLIVAHSNYDPITYSNDIALLRLSSPLMKDDSNVSPICLPSVHSSVLTSSEFPTSGTTVIAIGWGRLSEYGQVAKYLQQVTLTTVDYRSYTCNSLISDQKVQLCAGVPGGGKDTCQGDSGGPLMMFTSSKQWVLIGITSFGQGCARPSYAGVYTRVAAFEKWIDANTNGSYGSVLFSHAESAKSSIDYLLFFILLILHASLDA
ncbi:unnamed protein product [Rotaria socialis]|nr:unnamed protein product [Rotaria socialis]